MSQHHPGEVVVTRAGRDLRRRLGPSAWVVLEELVARAGPGDDVAPLVDVGTAELGQALGLSAEVTRSALRRLMAAGLVQREELRLAATRRFAGARYRIVATTGLVPAVGTGDPSAAEPFPAEPSADEPSVDEPDAGFPALGARPAGRMAMARSTRASGRLPSGQLDLLGLSPVDRPAEPPPKQNQKQHRSS